MNEMMMMTSRRSTVRMEMGMGITADGNDSVENAFLKTRAFLVVEVSRIIQWIIDQQQQHVYNQVQPPPASIDIDTPDVIPSIQARFPLSFRYMFSDMNLQQLHDEGFNQLLNDNFIPQDFWEEFTRIVSYGIKRLAEFEIRTRSSDAVLHVVVDVVRMERYNEERFLRHILTMRTSNPSTVNPDDDDQSSSKSCLLHGKLSMLWRLTFKRSVPSGNGTGNEEMVDASCSICLDEYSDGEKIMKMTCSHWFHSGCINRWFKKRNTCPFCRFQIS